MHKPEGKKRLLKFAMSALQGLCFMGSRSGWVDWLLSQVQGLHINIAGCKGLEGSKFHMVMVFKTANRTVKFLNFNYGISLVGCVDILMQCVKVA
jgi:hypothetical protein